MKATIILIILVIPFLFLFEIMSWNVAMYLVYFFLFSLCIYVHKKIIRRPNFEWYRWLINSLIYRYHVFLFKSAFKKFSYTQKIQYHDDIILQAESNPMWYDKYWFGRGLNNVLTNEIIKAHKKYENNLTK